MKVTFTFDADSSITTTPEKLSLVNLPDGKTLGIAFAGMVLLSYENVQAVPIPTAPATPAVPPAPPDPPAPPQT